MSKRVDQVREIAADREGRLESSNLPDIDDKEFEEAMREMSVPPTDADEPKQAKKGFFRNPKYLLAAAVLLVVGLIFGTRYYLHASTHESTDDAFVEGRVIQISPKVTGQVVKVYITDNQQVKKGDLLAEIGPRDYEAKGAKAPADLEAATSKKQAAEINVGLTSVTSGANVKQASSS